MNEYVAHIRKADGVEQSVFSHNGHVAELAAMLGQPYGMGSLARLTGEHHDDGKNTKAYCGYIHSAAANRVVVRGSVIHSTHGAVLVDSFSDRRNPLSILMAEMVRTAIMSHHGLRNCINGDGKLVFAEAKANIADSYPNVERIVLNCYGREKIEAEIAAAVEDVKTIQAKITEFYRESRSCGSQFFYLAMYVRLLTSILIDADRTDTTCFEDDARPTVPPREEERKKLWEQYLIHFQSELVGLISSKEPSVLDIYRAEISEACAGFDGGGSGIFRLVVPCGAGKTLSALLYALNTAKRYGKKRIFYIAPFNSILEQNADEIAKYIGDSGAVLRHHSNIVLETDDEEYVKTYKLLTENWQQAPVIATSAVQFLNTLFAGKTANVRRMQALGESVIIVDEIQALPIRTLKLFSGAMNFLAHFCGSAIILCSATQPLLDRLDSYRLSAAGSIVPNEERYIEAFRRLEIVADISDNGLSVADAAGFILDSAKDVRSVLAVVNTKAVAEKICENIRKRVGTLGEYLLFHLSTNMCPAHRTLVIAELRRQLKYKNQTKKIICISTTLIEAGVDLSFARVVRSLAGLDSIIQAAGRCNRNRETDCGRVYVIYIRDENVGRLGYIQNAQAVTREIFHRIETQPDRYPEGALSKAAMDEFYAMYYQPLLEEMAFPLKDDPERSILDLLTNNCLGSRKLANPKSIFLKQAFKEAGQAFEVIEELGAQDVIVEYNDEARLHIKQLLSESLLSEQKKQLRYLQQYTVQLSRYSLDKISDGVRFEEKAGVYILSEPYYHGVYGIKRCPPTRRWNQGWKRSGTRLNLK